MCNRVYEAADEEYAADAERGTHDELMAKGGVFATLANRQM